MRSESAAASAIVVVLLAGSACAATAHKGHTAQEAEAIAIRMAQVDAVQRLTERVLAAEVPGGRTVGECLGQGSRDEIALRVFLRSARRVGAPRVYSDGVAQVDVHVPADVLRRRVLALCGLEEGGSGVLALESRTVDGYLGESGTGRPVPDLSDAAVARLMTAPADDLVEMYPAGWERVTATGRVLAIRAARVAAYDAMADRLRAILLAPGEAVGDLVGSASTAKAAFEAYVRSLAVVGPPRLMPDRIAEVQVAAPLRGLIDVLKDIRRLRAGDTPVTEEQLDRLTVRIKAERITVTGRGLPPAEEIRPAAAPPVAGGEALPDWATTVLLATGRARVSRDVPEPKRGGLLAARSAKVRALADLDRQVNRVVLESGNTIRNRAATDPAFRKDLEMFLDSAQTVRYGPIDDGRAWEVVLRLPLLRLYECSRRQDE